MKTQELEPLRDPISPEDYREAISALPTGVTVITAAGKEGPVGCTVNALLSLSLAPPTLLVSLATASRTLAEIFAAGAFAVNVLPWSDRDLTQRFARGTQVERFEGVPWERVHGVPVLSRASAGFVCTVGDAVPLLDHTVVAGTVRWTRSGGPCASVLYRHQQYPVGG